MITQPTASPLPALGTGGECHYGYHGNQQQEDQQITRSCTNFLLDDYEDFSDLPAWKYRGPDAT
jgi:hypothetical protein